MFRTGRGVSRNDYTATELVGLLRSDSKAEREAALVELRHRARGDEPGIVEAVIILLKDADAYLRLAAVDILQQSGSDAASAGLISAFNDHDEEVQRAALTAVKSRQSISAEPLYAALHDADPEIRWRVAQALSVNAEPRHIAALSGALQDNDARVRREAVLGLGRSNHDAAIAPLAGALSGDADGDVRWRAAQALGKLRSQSAADGLVPALGDPDPQIRVAVALSLAKLGDMRAFDTLVDALATAGDDLVMRNWSIEGLQSLGEPGYAAIQALTEDDE